MTRFSLNQLFPLFFAEFGGTVRTMSENQIQLSSIDRGSNGIQLAEATVLHHVIAELSTLSVEDRRRILETVTTFFGINRQKEEFPARMPSSKVTMGDPSPFQFSESEEVLSPKAFMLQKAPRTDIERVACLAYYLSRYRDTPHLKTKDISALNTESAHRAFSNASMAVENSAKGGFLVPSIKGCKQLSAMGEQFVEALPDRDAANEVHSRIRHRRFGGNSRKEPSKPAK